MNSKNQGLLKRSSALRWFSVLDDNPYIHLYTETNNRIYVSIYYNSGTQIVIGLSGGTITGAVIGRASKVTIARISFWNSVSIAT